MASQGVLSLSRCFDKTIGLLHPLRCHFYVGLQDTILKQKGSSHMISNNKRCFSANGFSLLPLALRPRLFCTLMAIIAITIVVLFSTIITTSNNTYATASTLTLSLSNDTTSVDVTPISSTGTFKAGSNNTISVSTNNYTGYTLSIKAKTTGTNATKLIDSSTNTTIDTLPTNTSIDANTFKNNTTYNNMWGYLPQMYHSEFNSTYRPAPSTSGDIINTTSCANGTAGTTCTNATDTYTMSIGAKIDTTVAAGAYTNTFVITAVANAIPYTITYYANAGSDVVSNMPINVNDSTYASTITLSSNVPTRTGYTFNGWCTSQVAAGTTCNGTEYVAGGTYNIDQITGSNELVFYAIWNPTITFRAGNNIETIIVADSSQNYKPFYATASRDITFTNVLSGRKYIVTVVPKANYTLDTATPWTSSTDSTAGLASYTLLTTTYTVGNIAETLIANGSEETSSYITMKDFTKANCTAATNVTDERDGKSYTVAPIGSYCYMLSDLRLDGGIELDSLTSDIESSGVTYVDPNTGETITTTTFTVPTEAWQGYYCKAVMKSVNNEYYYNWYAAKANPYQCNNPTSYTNATKTNDNYSLGSICPKNWRLPTYADASSDINSNNLWDGGSNYGMLVTKGGYLGGQQYLGTSGYWWLNDRSTNNRSYYLSFSGKDISSSFSGGASLKRYGQSVRCIRSN